MTAPLATTSASPCPWTGTWPWWAPTVTTIAAPPRARPTSSSAAAATGTSSRRSRPATAPRATTSACAYPSVGMWPWLGPTRTTTRARKPAPPISSPAAEPPGPSSRRCSATTRPPATGTATPWPPTAWACWWARTTRMPRAQTPAPPTSSPAAGPPGPSSKRSWPPTAAPAISSATPWPCPATPRWWARATKIPGEPTPARHTCSGVAAPPGPSRKCSPPPTAARAISSAPPSRSSTGWPWLAPRGRIRREPTRAPPTSTFATATYGARPRRSPAKTATPMIASASRWWLTGIGWPWVLAERVALIRAQPMCSLARVPPINRPASSPPTTGRAVTISATAWA